MVHSDKEKTAKSTAGRKCSICTHKDASKINLLIAEPVSFRNISERFGMGIASISRHTTDHLKLDLQALVAQKKVKRVVDFEEMLANLIFKVEKMANATEKWLSDPDDPDEFDIAPRSNEIQIIYNDFNQMFMGKPTRKKAVLGDLLEELAEGGRETLEIKSLAVDNRKLFLDTFKTFTDRLDQYAKFHGLFQKDRENEKTIDKIAALVNKFLLDKPEFERCEAVRVFAERANVDERELSQKVIKLISEMEQ